MKRLQKEAFRIIYPQYLDSKRSRSEGRRVSKLAATSAPTLKDLTSALESLGLKYQVQEGLAHPRDHAKKSFRIIVFTSKTKCRLLDDMAKKLKSA
jgi:signal recognition particle subunit SRP19